MHHNVLPTLQPIPLMTNVEVYRLFGTQRLFKKIKPYNDWDIWEQLATSLEYMYINTKLISKCCLQNGINIKCPICRRQFPSPYRSSWQIGWLEDDSISVVNWTMAVAIAVLTKRSGTFWWFSSRLCVRIDILVKLWMLITVSKNVCLSFSNVIVWSHV